MSRVSLLVTRVLLVLYLVALGLVVFLPADDADRVTGLVAWAAEFVASLGAPREPAEIVLEFVANVALFVPFGVLVLLAFPRARWWVVLIGCLTSIGIELVQLAIPSRVSTVSDVVANTVGTALGVALVRWWALSRRAPALEAGSEGA